MEGKNAEEVKGMLGEENNEERRRWNKKVQYKEDNKKKMEEHGVRQEKCPKNQY